MHLDADQMDKLIERVEDAGVSVVDEDGEPSKASLKAANHTAEEAKRTFQLHLVLRSMIRFGCI